MALSGLDIYKLLPKTNCKQCGVATCLAFAMQLAKKAVPIDKCPYLSDEAKRILEASSEPPIKLVTIGTGDDKLEIGNETVMFRHEEKFHRPCGLGFIIEDNLGDDEIVKRLGKINQFRFERIGQELKADLVAVRQKSSAERFAAAVKIVLENTKLSLILMSDELKAQEAAIKIVKERRPLIYCPGAKELTGFAKLAKEFNLPLVASSADLGSLSNLTKELNKEGVVDLILDTGSKPIAEKIWDLTQIRRLALKKSERSLGYPVLAVAENDDPYEEAIEAATYITKYAGIVLVKAIVPWEVLSLLTLRQNIYTDPQKPLQIEPKIYPVGAVNKNSPVLVTTNFSLTYYTVLGEVEASKISSYIISVDTQGMSVLTAWAAEKFTPEKITEAVNKSQASIQVTHKNLIIPGYVAVISGDLEERCGWKVIVGPKEAAGIPSFLKNL